MVRTDTTVEAEKKQIEIFRKMGPEKRLINSVSLAQTSRRLLAAGVRMRHPEYSDDQVRLATIRLILGDAVFAAAYPEAMELGA
ncbi:MAG: hypothetical protein JRJ03_18470 [Deltaproteobacteria bacterium]|nr:hypothetical protein [Deltaproteobacteria bacterium]MBW2066899.1 hypothetical protein [Deltaproteobacteria bacterium]